MSVWRRRYYRGLNAAMRILLRSPLHPLRSGRVLLLEFSGRRSGRRYLIPVSHWDRPAGQAICLSSTTWARWWVNLDDADVVLYIYGQRRPGHATLVDDPEVAPELDLRLQRPQPPGRPSLRRRTRPHRRPRQRPAGFRRVTHGEGHRHPPTAAIKPRRAQAGLDRTAQAGTVGHGARPELPPTGGLGGQATLPPPRPRLRRRALARVSPRRPRQATEQLGELGQLRVVEPLRTAR